MRSIGPGIYHNTSFEEYVAIDAINWSKLKPLDVSDAQAKHELRFRKSSAAMEFGTLVHTAVLEPRVFEQKYAVMPKVDRRTKQGKEAYAKAMEEAEQHGRELVHELDWKAACHIRDNLYRNAEFAEILNNSKKEVSLVWEDPETGLMCKGRVDMLGDGPVADLKTTSMPPTDWNCAANIKKYLYYGQAAYYLWGLRCLTGFTYGPYMIAWAETKNARHARVIALDDEWIRAGWQKARGFLTRWHKNLTSGDWPGFAPVIETLECPTYLRAEEEDA